MACLIAKGRQLTCKDLRGGIKYIDFVAYDDYGFVITEEEVVAIPAMITEVFRYELKGATNTLVETATVNADNRTTEVTQVITATFPKLKAAAQVELKAMLYSRVIAFVHDNNGDVHAVGIDSGADATTGTKQTGGAGGDLTGYNVTLQAMDKSYSPMLSSAAKIALNALVSTDIIAD